MKKILALTLTGLLVIACSGMAVTATAQGNDLPSAQSEAATRQINLYLVPGTYVSGGKKVENGISSGATKLTPDECAEIFTENAYLCTLSKGAALPVPTSKRVDKNGVAYKFNGWWSIVDATVTYFDKVPGLSETTYLYADWRADLSQRKDPIIPDPGVEIEAAHYLSIKRKETGETEKITLRKAYTNVGNAETLGYSSPVELYAEGLELSPGDVITVYTTGLTASEKAVISPILNGSNSREINLESSGDGSNVTADYLSADAGSQRRNPTVTCIAEATGYYNIYIKYFSKGSVMAVYMEPQA